MATQSKMKLTIVSQEKKLDELEVDQLTVMTAAGEITILPGHIPLMSKLVPGIMTYKSGDTSQEMVISNGFLDVEPQNKISVLVDTATHARDVSIQRAEQAIEAAQRTMAESSDKRELLLAEASLKHAMLEIQLAQKSKKTKI